MNLNNDFFRKRDVIKEKNIEEKIFNRIVSALKEEGHDFAEVKLNGNGGQYEKIYTLKDIELIMEIYPYVIKGAFPKDAYKNIINNTPEKIKCFKSMFVMKDELNISFDELKNITTKMHNEGYEFSKYYNSRKYSLDDFENIKKYLEDEKLKKKEISYEDEIKNLELNLIQLNEKTNETEGKIKKLKSLQFKKERKRLFEERINNIDFNDEDGLKNEILHYLNFLHEPKENNTSNLNPIVTSGMETLEFSTFLLKIIGKTGISRNKDLKAYFETLDTKPKFYKSDKLDMSRMNNITSILEQRGLLSTEIVRFSIKNNAEFISYKLSDAGEKLYFDLTDEASVESDFSLLYKTHGSLEHGFMVREIAEEFENMGHKVILIKEQSNVEKEKTFFDLIVEDGKKKRYIMVDKFKRNIEQFFDEMDKAFLITKDIYIISNNGKTLYNETKSKVSKWIVDRYGGLESLKGKLNLHFTTIERIQSRKKPNKNYHGYFWDDLSV
ncbi:hypothetical protein [Bacillus thuringiensis]|uniref:hypothetical protein n=1 Tax=Bacillus thuringiensis TaxID=1428 RepID=UPI0021D693AE|nr:hypothetical protein [Bacillus thuringiensis]MCU7667755.1 hypothetical protein [Bacillus thuringiensis]